MGTRSLGKTKGDDVLKGRLARAVATLTLALTGVVAVQAPAPAQAYTCEWLFEAFSDGDLGDDWHVWHLSRARKLSGGSGCNARMFVSYDVKGIGRHSNWAEDGDIDYPLHFVETYNAPYSRLQLRAQAFNTNNYILHRKYSILYIYNGNTLLTSCWLYYGQGITGCAK